MNFDFYTQYKDYSNLDLLKIVQRPDEYQADAVNAATKILSERKVSSENLEEVEVYYEQIENADRLKTDKINSYKEKAYDLVQPLIHPQSEVMPAKWLNIFLTIIGLQYVWTLFITIKSISRFIQVVMDCKIYGFDHATQPTLWTCFTNRFDIFIFFELLTIIYVPFIFYLLYKRRRWGWILLFADNLFGLISSVCQSYYFFKYQQIHHGGTSTFFFHLILKGIFVFFLWKNNMSDFFGVSLKTKKNTVIITTIATLIFVFGVQLFV